ncbi:MAG: 50S ribosomal L9 C-terminal domain-containing protein [Gammaproteobacteria bacterium WSBS_2016_MAG_OTU1]
MYGSITVAVIAAALNAEKITEVDIRRGQLSLSAGNLKEIGDHEVGIMLAADVEAKITVSVLSDEAEAQGDNARKGGQS